MADVTSRPGLPLWSDYTAFARRHARSIGALMLVGLLVGFAWSLPRPSSYSATASVALTPVPKYLTPSTSELVAPAVTIDTDAQLLQSPQVLGAVADVLGTSPAAAGEHVSVSASPNSHVLHVTVRSRSPELAAAAADAAVSSLITLRREVLGSLQLEQLRQLQALLTVKEEELAKEQANRLIIPATDELFGEVVALRTALDELEEARREPARVVQPAQPPTRTDYPNTEVPVVSGLMLGLLAGCLLGAGRDRWRALSQDAGFARNHPHLSGRPLPVPTTTLHEESRHV
jgi:uncharacterized protein involved in exopolysaccharide biosynthesis